jgi:hypothetical protein
LYYYHKKDLKNTQKTKNKKILVGFLGGFFWLSFLLPTLSPGDQPAAGQPLRRHGDGRAAAAATAAGV